VNNGNGQCGAIASYTATATGSPTPTLSYTFSGATAGAGSGTGSGQVFNVGITNVTITAANTCGSSTCSFTVTVVDIIKPVISCPDNVQVIATSASGAIVNYATPVATDNCSVASMVMTSGMASGSKFPIGKTTVSYRATDASGNYTDCAFIVTVNGLPPVINCPSAITVNNATGKCGANVSFAATETVGIPASIITYTVAPGSFFTTGTAAVTATATNAVGTSICTFNITVVDNEAPVVPVLATVTGECSATVTATPTATDNCAGTVIGTTSDPLTYTAQGTYVIHWAFNDGHGNTSTQTQTVIVKDVTPPTVLTKNITVTLVNGAVSIVPADVNNGSFDACGIGSMTLSQSTFNCSNIGSNTVILKVTDVNGNTASASATVTVIGAVPVATITSVPTSNVYTGGISTNLYLGYGAQSTTLQVNAPADGAPYTYKWSGSSLNLLSNASSQAPLFTPVQYGSYTFSVLVTNKYGCTSAATIGICVTDIRVPGSNGKVYICHLPPGNPANRQTLSISVNAVASHLSNHAGDRLGSCDQTPCSLQNTTSSIGGLTTSVNSAPADVISKAISLAEELRVTVMPNPSSSYFTLKLESRNNAPVDMRVMDSQGRLVDAKPKIGSNSTIQVGHNYISGTYYAEMIQGSTRKVLQLIKER
jgi:hypothetical protein